MIRGMVIDMNDEQLHTVARLRAFVGGTAAVNFSVAPDERYDFIARTVRRLGYARLKRTDKGVILRFPERVSGYSRRQLTPMCCCWRLPIPCTARCAEPLPRSSWNAPLRCLASTATSVWPPHLYNLRKRAGYARQRQTWTKTRPVTSPIGERRAPAPNNRPGYLRVDSVHQGDQDSVKGLYHINAVDCVTQYEGVATRERISEAFLIPVLAALLAGFPFVILGFHVDNGSEYINRHVAELLNKLLIEEFTKSRSRHGNDNAQVESKNGAIVRKHLGYGHIPQRYATLVNAFRRDYLNPYVNFHRPSLFAETITDAKGRQRGRYPYKPSMTPYDKLKSLPLAAQFLKSGITFQQLDTQANAISDNDAVQRLNDARATMFKNIFNRSKTAA